MSQTYKQAIRERVAECMEIAREKWGVDLKDIPTEFYTHGRALGFAHYSIGPRTKGPDNRYGWGTTPTKLRFSLEGAKWLDYMLKDVVSHEVAHLVCFCKPDKWLFTGRGFNKSGQPRMSAHGRWHKMICRSFGGSGTTKHPQKITKHKKRLQRRYLYRLTCGTEIAISGARHKKVLNGKVYTFRTTSGELGRSQFVRMVSGAAAAKINQR